jgi:hypothetical protein
MNWKNQFIKRDNIKQHNKTRKYYTLSLYNWGSMYFNTQTDRMLTHHKAITKPSPPTQQRTNPQYNKRFPNTMIINDTSYHMN